MHFVFVAGSRALSRLNPQITERLDNIMRQNFSVLIGDANGADKAVQHYLAKVGYRNVVVYCMEVCRNNLGHWPVRPHATDPGVKRDRFYYGIKDSAMVKDATCGFMLWDGVSKGTLTNVIGLLNADKNALLYISAEKEFFNICNVRDLHKALNAAGINDISQFLSSNGIEKPVPRHLQFTSEDVMPHNVP